MHYKCEQFKNYIAKENKLIEKVAITRHCNSKGRCVTNSLHIKEVWMCTNEFIPVVLS